MSALSFVLTVLVQAVLLIFRHGRLSHYLFTVYPADDDGLEETAPEQGHSTSSVVVKQLENVNTSLDIHAHQHDTLH